MRLTQRHGRWIALSLLLIVFAVYGQTYRFQFVNYDDDEIVQFRQIHTGLSGANVMWAFTAVVDYWRPLTRLSHMTVCHFFGLKAGVHHIANVALHGLNVLLLFAVLHRMTGRLWRSGFVAALFAAHPLHVESVAWITERKDVLSALFWMLTLWAYRHWVEHPGSRRYALLCTFFALGLMAKPMLVTLPAALMLLDYWPLQRAEAVPWKRRVVEKLPLFGLSLAAATVVFIGQLWGGALTPLGKLPVSGRIYNALVSYNVYLFQAVWPFRLAVIYPHPGYPPFWQVIVSAIVLLGITAGVIRARRRHQYLWVGWLWYAGLLVPVIGLTQSGAQAHADRFVYLPLIGIYIAVVWGISDLLFHRCPKQGPRLTIGALLSAGMVGVLAATSFRQTRYWRNSLTLFDRAIAVTRNNAVAHENRGMALVAEKRYAEGIVEYHHALQLDPGSTTLQSCIGDALVQQGKPTEALQHLQEAARLNPKDGKRRLDLADALTAMGRLDEAVAQYQELVRLRPDIGWVRYQLAWRLERLDRWTEAVVEYREAIRLSPHQPEALSALARLLAACPDPAIRNGVEAVRLAERALKQRPEDSLAREVLTAASTELRQESPP